MQVQISEVLSGETRLEYLAAQRAAKVALDRYRMADAVAFYTILRSAGIGLHDTVIVRKDGVEINCILVGTRKFAKINKKGTASRNLLRIAAPYTVEKVKGDWEVQREKGELE